MGIVAATPHQSGRTKSAIRPSPTNSIQNTLRSTTFILDLGRNIEDWYDARWLRAFLLARRSGGAGRALAGVMIAMAKNEGGSAEAEAVRLPSFVAAAIQ